MLKASFRALGARVIRSLPPPLDYRARLLAEKLVYRFTPSVHALPPIFHYWSNRWLRPRFEAIGFSSPEDFFRRRALAAARARPQGTLRVLSIGCGHAQLEHALATAVRAEGLPDPAFTLVDVNRHVLRSAVARFSRDRFPPVVAIAADLNAWRPQQAYDLVVANQCLHHVVSLESLLDGIRDHLAPDGRLLVSDVIGRNGHRLWPEARAALEPFWDRIPRSKRYDRTRGRLETAFIDHDHSMAAFEGIRSQDILPLLVERFGFGTFAPHSCLVIPIVERRFGWNFSADDPDDRAYIDSLDAADQRLLGMGAIKPTQLVAELGPPGEMLLDQIAPWASPAACIRDTST